MASTALEEKINKIRLRNEEIKRRYEEVEADKKNAAKLDALSEQIPPEEWPERKEPPEFRGPVVKKINKPKHPSRKHSDQTTQYYAGSGEGKKSHAFPDGQGPPPDPKYNFLADSEREERADEMSKDAEKNRGRNRTQRGGFKRRGSGRDWHTGDHWNQYENPANMTHPEYEAWRAERNRIDEARISRQRTAEGNWRREWDNDKMHLADDITKRETRVTLGEVTRQESDDNEKYYRSPRPVTKNYNESNGRESQEASTFLRPIKSLGPVFDGKNRFDKKRLVVASDTNIRVSLNAEGSAGVGSSLMSVKVSSPNIAGTGRVGPRQRPRVTYSTQSEADALINENPFMTRQKSMDEGPKVRSFDQTHKITSPKSPHHPRRSDGRNAYPTSKENAEGTMKPSRKDGDSLEGQRSSRKDLQKSPRPSNQPPKSPGFRRKPVESSDNDRSTLPGAQNKNVAENLSPREISRISVDSITKLITLAPEEKPDDLINIIYRGDDKNEMVISEVEKILRSTEKSTGNNSVVPVRAQPEIPSCSTAGDTRESHENRSPDSSNDTGKEKLALPLNDGKEHNDSVDDAESIGKIINLSADSAISSNDSGFIELPSNDSIHDISGNEAVEKLDVNRTEPQASTSRAEEDFPIVNFHENKSAGSNNEEAHVESKDLEIEVNDSRAKIDGKIANISGNIEYSTGSGEKVESEGEEPSEVDKLVKVAVTEEGTNDSPNDEAPIVLTRPKNDDKNTDDSAVPEIQDFSAQEKDELCYKSLT